MDIDDNQLELKDKQLGEILRTYFNEPGWPRLSLRSFMVWTVLVSKAAPVVGITSLSHNRIRRMTGIGSNATVARGLDELINKGYLRVLDIGGVHSHPTVYRLLHHRLPGSVGRIKHGEISDRVCDTLEEAGR